MHVCLLLIVWLPNGDGDERLENTQWVTYQLRMYTGAFFIITTFFVWLYLPIEIYRIFTLHMTL